MRKILDILGLAPLLVATGPGSEIRKPLAVVVVGGVFTSTALTLVLLPIFYEWVQSRAERGVATNGVPAKKPNAAKSETPKTG